MGSGETVAPDMLPDDVVVDADSSSVHALPFVDGNSEHCAGPNQTH